MLAMQIVAPGAVGQVSDASQPGKPFHDALEASAGQFERLIADQPSEPAHHVGLADVRIVQWCFGFAPHKVTMPAAEQAVRRALHLDPNLTPAHTALGIVEMGHWDWLGAEKSFRRAVELDPDSAKAQHWLALFLSALGQSDEALRHSRRAVALEPTAGYRTGLGAVLYFARQFPEMIRHMEGVVADHPDFAPGYDWLGMAYVEVERFDDSIRTYERAVELSGNLAEIRAGLGHAHGVAGNRAAAIAIRDELATLAQSYHIPPVQRAFVEVSLGDHDAALRLLQRAADERAWEVSFLRVEPWLDDLRDLPRFVELQRRLNFLANE
jgi:tetratricopeptide (TPR) repeat protein